MNILHISDPQPKIGNLPLSYIKSFKKKECVGVNDVVYPNVIWKKSAYGLVDRVINRVINVLKIKEKNLFFKLKNIDFKKYDIVFVYKGIYVKPEYIDFIREKNSNIKIVCYNPDDPYNDASSNFNILNSIKKYDIYFIWSKRLKQKISDKERVLTYYLPFAADLSLHNKMRFNNLEKRYKITFIGNWDKERERWLNDIKDKNSLKLFGNNWLYKLRSKELLKCTGGEVIGDEFVKVAQESIININILRVQNKNSNNMRTFELPASGGFCLHEYSEEVAELFEEGKEIEFYRDSQELNDKIDFYINNPESAEKIANNGYNRIVSSNYTYDKRVEEILKILKGG